MQVPFARCGSSLRVEGGHVKRGSRFIEVERFCFRCAKDLIDNKAVPTVSVQDKAASERPKGCALPVTAAHSVTRNGILGRSIGDCEALYVPAWIVNEDWLNRLLDIGWTRERVKLYGKVLFLTCTFSVP
jgi:hypothetical protein